MQTYNRTQTLRVSSVCWLCTETWYAVKTGCGRFSSHGLQLNWLTSNQGPMLRFGVTHTHIHTKFDTESIRILKGMQEDLVAMLSNTTAAAKGLIHKCLQLRKSWHFSNGVYRPPPAQRAHMGTISGLHKVWRSVRQLAASVFIYLFFFPALVLDNAKSTSATVQHICGYMRGWPMIL